MSLTINDLFWTIQGEGAHAGRRALFVRMPFCNLACSWCDTKFDTYQPFSVEAFKAFAQLESARFAVITGGEPLMHRHTPVVVKALKDLGYEIACETNGTMKPVDGIDFVTCSPKRDAGFTIHADLWPRVSEFKYVVDATFDFALLARHDAEPEQVRLSLSPEFGNFEVSVKSILSFIQENPRWRLSLQTHKWIGVP